MNTLLFHLCVMYLLLICGYSMSHGFFSFQSLAIVSGAFFFGLRIWKSLPWKSPPKKVLLSHTYQTYTLLSWCFIASLVLTIIFYGGLYQQGPLLPLSIVLLFLALIVSLDLLYPHGVPPSQQKIRRHGITLIVIAFIVRFFMVWSSPNPRIDTYYILYEGALGLLHGLNPYQMTFTPLYVGITSDYFTYQPGALLLTLPSSLFLGDPRYAFIIADIVTVVFLYRLARNKTTLYPIIYLFLYSPMALYVLEESYGDILLNPLLFAALYFSYKKKHILKAFSFGLFLTIKTFNFSLFPFFLKRLGTTKRDVGIILTTVLFLTLPFFMWSPKDFLHDTIGSYLYNPIPFTVYTKSLSLSALVYHLSGLLLSLSNLLPLFITFYLYILLRENIFSTVSQFLLAAFSWIFLFTFIAQQAFVNHYYFLSNILLFAMAFYITEQS